MRSLVSYLNERTPQELRQMAERWEASLSERLYAGNTFQLSQEMTSSFLQRRLLEKLSPSALEMLQYFLAQPDFTTSIPEIVVQREMDLARAAEIVGQLRQVGLLFEEKIPLDNQTQETVPAEPPRRGWNEIYGRRSGRVSSLNTKTVMRLPRELGRPLKRLLNEYIGSHSAPFIKPSHRPLVQLLKEVEPEVLELEADTWGIYNLDGGNDSQVIEEMAQALADPLIQQRVLASLPQDSQELFARLKKENRITVTKLLGDYVSLRRLGRTIRPLIDKLLVWEAFEEGSSLVFVPQEIANPQPMAARKTTPLQTAVEPMQPTPYPPYALAWDILTFLNYIGQIEVELTNQNYIPKRHLKKLVTKLWLPEDTDELLRTSFMIDMCYSFKLYQIEEYDKQLLTLGSELDNWLRLDLYEQNRRFFEQWLTKAYSGFPVAYPYYYSPGESINRANRAILNWLTQCQPNVWYTMDSLLAKVQREDPYFIRSRRDLLNQIGIQRLETLTKMWDKIEGEIIRATFSTAL